MSSIYNQVKGTLEVLHLHNMPTTNAFGLCAVREFENPAQARAVYLFLKLATHFRVNAIKTGKLQEMPGSSFEFAYFDKTVSLLIKEGSQRDDLKNRFLWDIADTVEKMSLACFESWKVQTPLLNVRSPSPVERVFLRSSPPPVPKEVFKAKVELEGVDDELYRTVDKFGNNYLSNGVEMIASRDFLLLTGDASKVQACITQLKMQLNKAAS
jgi:hypothetical protein